MTRRTYAAVALVCATFLAGCSGSDEQDPAKSKSSVPADRMVDVGGRSLHLHCEGSGTPTIVFESGLDGEESAWNDIAAEFKADSRVCTYSRANIPPSDERPGMHTAADSAADLDAMLDASKEKGPYVVVGFSIGGLITQLYATEHPQNVAGLVLVEANHPEESEQFEQHLTPEQIEEDRAQANTNTERLDLVASFTPAHPVALPEVPLVVVTAGKSEPWPPGWDEQVFDRLRAAQQKELAASVPGGTQVIAKESGHDVPHDQPEVVISAISKVLESL